MTQPTATASSSRALVILAFFGMAMVELSLGRRCGMRGSGLQIGGGNVGQPQYEGDHHQRQNAQHAVGIRDRQHQCLLADDSHQLSGLRDKRNGVARSEEHTSELQSLMRISYAVFCLNKTKANNSNTTQHIQSNV